MKRKFSELDAGFNHNSRKKIKLNNIQQESSSRSLPSFVQCPICKSSVYKTLINFHIDTGCITNKTIKNKKKKKSNISNNNITSKPLKKPFHKWIKCPLCNKSLLSTQINFHIDLECPKLKNKNKKKKKKKKKNKKKHNKGNNFKSKVTQCPKCGDNVLLTQINMHLDLKCDEQKKKWIDNHKINKPSLQFDIFNYRTPVPGLYLYKEFITEQESKDILTEINQNKWSKNRGSRSKLRGTRRCQHYGPPMDEMYRVVSSSKYFTQIPQLSKLIGKRISNFWTSCSNIPCGSLNNKLSMKANDFNELFVNEYQSHDELLLHFDQRGAFEELLCGISLCSESIMSFQHNDNTYDMIKVLLPPRSVYFMSGDSRYKYKHGFIINDIHGYRVSLTYRTVKTIFYDTKPPKKNTQNVYTTSTSKQVKLDTKFFTKSKLSNQL